MRIGVAYDLKEFHQEDPSLPLDIHEEFDIEETIESIEKALYKKFDWIVRLGGGKKFLENIQKNNVNFVFNIAEGFGTRSREAHIPSVLEILGIPFSGSDPLTLALTLDKALTKRVLLAEGILTPNFFEINDLIEIKKIEKLLKQKNLKFPLIVKLSHEGSSMGLRLNSVVKDIFSLKQKTEELISLYREPVLIEEFISGREITAGVIGNGKTAECFGMMEISHKRLKNEDFIYSLEVKRNWREEVIYTINPDMSPEVEKTISKEAVKIFQILKCRDISRIDFRLDQNEKAYFLEINPLPGLNPDYSDLPMIARGMGIEYDDLILRIVKEAFTRYSIIF
ncbi:MAG: ATP-grasp domain-containing protein [Acidobacteriota bacterium]